jgi:hypothetical protein
MFRSPSGSIRVASLLAGGAFALAPLAVGCNRVVEQPPAPIVAPPPPAPAKASRPAPRRPPGLHNPAFGPGAANAGPRGPQAPKSNAYRELSPEEKEAAQVMTLQRDKLQKVLDDALPSFTSCWANETALDTSIAFEVTGAGRAENVRMPGAPEGAARCVTERVRGLALPTYVGPVLSIQIPVKVASRVENRAGGEKVAAAAGSPSGTPAPAPAAEAPKLFVSP